MDATKQTHFSAQQCSETFERMKDVALNGGVKVLSQKDCAIAVLEIGRLHDRITALESELAQAHAKTRHAERSLSMSEADLAKMRAECERLRDVLLRHGFVVCDIPACNCGSWHHRYGLPERMQEIRDALTEAGVLDNSTGNLPLNAIRKLVEQRNAARKEGA